MPILSGTTNRPRVVVFHQHEHLPVVDTTTDINGDWSAEVPASTPMMVLYLNPGCQPELHGPYEVDE